ncbi:MAG: PHB depolymerase family esterase [Myxococcales bacterium]
MHTLHRSALTLLAATALAACGVEQDAALAEADLGTTTQRLTAVTGFGSNPGGLNMYTYVPSGMPANAPLVVAMHGCTMGASDYANAGWNQLADLWKFYVVYPEMPSGVRCFLWYDLSQNKRDQGEALSIKQMVDYMKGHYGIDASRVFVTGLSAGGGMTATMLAAYPDVFAAGAPMAGLPYRCADSIGDSGSCMGSGKSQAAKTWGDLVRGAYPGFSGPWPRVSIWQGASDYTVSTANSAELMKQWTNVHGIDQTAEATGRVDTATHTEYRDGSGQTLVETWLVDSMGHGTAVKPGFTPAGGCGQAGNFVLSAGICSTYYAARFFGLDSSGPIQPGDAGTVTPPVGADAGSPPPPGPDASTPPPACNEWNTNNYEHVQQGRAVQCGSYNSYVCTVGSNENLGLYSLGIITWVREVGPGYYEAGKCADRPVIPPGPDAGTEPPPGLDASVEPGPDAATLPGADAAAEPSPDAAAQPEPDAGAPSGSDAAAEPEPGPDASARQPGPDAAAPQPGADAGSPGRDAGAAVVNPDAHVPGPLDPPAADGGTIKRADAGDKDDPRLPSSGAAAPLGPARRGWLRSRCCSSRGGGARPVRRPTAPGDALAH